jgi:hemin uptake protein HemP
MNLPMPLPATLHTPTLPAKPDAVQPSVSSNDILRGQKAVEISHNGCIYKLQATRLGKLILTK